MCFSLCLHIQQQRRYICRRNIRHFHLTKRRIYPAVKIALKAAPAILADRDGLCGHKHPFPILAQGLNLRGLLFLQEVFFFLFGSADSLAIIAAALKFGGYFCKFAVNGLLAPSLRRIPTRGQARAGAPARYLNFIENLSGFILPLSD